MNDSKQVFLVESSETKVVVQGPSNGQMSNEAEEAIDKLEAKFEGQNFRMTLELV